MVKIPSVLGVTHLSVSWPICFLVSPGHSQVMAPWKVGPQRERWLGTLVCPSVLRARVLSSAHFGSYINLPVVGIFVWLLFLRLICFFMCLFFIRRKEYCFWFCKCLKPMVNPALPTSPVTLKNVLVVLCLLISFSFPYPHTTYP